MTVNYNVEDKLNHLSNGTLSVTSENRNSVDYKGVSIGTAVIKRTWKSTVLKDVVVNSF